MVSSNPIFKRIITAFPDTNTMFGAGRAKRELIEKKERELQSQAEELSERLSNNGFILVYNVRVLCEVTGKRVSGFSSNTQSSFLGKLDSY